MHFNYTDVELDYLRKKDKKLGEAIDRIGYIERTVDTDLFSAVIHHIIGQQISVSAQITVWNRLCDLLKDVTAETILSTDINTLQKCGMTFRKAEYIASFSRSIINKELILEELYDMSDDEVISKLTSIKGIGVWTAEMILTFCMQRPNVISYDDLAIQRGLRMLYRHKKITRKLFNKYKKRYSPYATTAAIYIWAVAGNALLELKDPAQTKK